MQDIHVQDVCVTVNTYEAADPHLQGFMALRYLRLHVLLLFVLCTTIFGTWRLCVSTKINKA